MKLDQLKKNVGRRAQLGPPAIRLDPLGRELPSKEEVWTIKSVTEAEVHLHEDRVSGLTARLGHDYVHSWSTNPSRSVPGGAQYCFLKLTVQIVVQQASITYRMCPMPNVRVDPLPATLAELSVDSEFPTRSGIQAKLAASGYEVQWCLASRVPTNLFDGSELVIENDSFGIPSTFHWRINPEDQILIKRRRKR
jgi:hypothetical protein